MALAGSRLITNFGVTMSIFKDILTGADNQTVAIGRWMGVVLLAVTIGVIVVEPISVELKKVSLEEWGAMLAQWQVFVPIMCGTAVGLIAGTAFTEPKKKDSGE